MWNVWIKTLHTGCNSYLWPKHGKTNWWSCSRTFQRFWLQLLIQRKDKERVSPSHQRDFKDILGKLEALIIGSLCAKIHAQSAFQKRKNCVNYLHKKTHILCLKTLKLQLFHSESWGVLWFRCMLPNYQSCTFLIKEEGAISFFESKTNEEITPAHMSRFHAASVTSCRRHQLKRMYINNGAQSLWEALEYFWMNAAYTFQNQTLPSHIS